MGSSSSGIASQFLNRFRQGITALTSTREPAPFPKRYRSAVPSAVVARWSNLSPYDQHHLMHVAGDLERGGCDDELVLAGLLHDIGKSGRITFFDRTAAVLIARLLPPLARWIEHRTQPPPALGGIHLLLRHAEEGARFLESCGGIPPKVTWLVRHHESRMGHPGLAALRTADDRH